MAKKSRAFNDNRDDDFGDMNISDEELERLMAAAGAPSPRAPERRPETEFESLEPGTRVRGTVIDVRGGEVLVELDSKTHGVIAEEEYADDPLPTIGSVVQAQYLRYDRPIRMLVIFRRDQQPALDIQFGWHIKRAWRRFGVRGVGICQGW